MVIEATFVRSAASAGDLPRDELATIALVGRSNVGKSSLINALVRRPLARTSAAPGKTRLANVYRVRRASRSSRGTAAPLYLVDLPGYGYARGHADEFRGLAAEAVLCSDAALLLVDARHPGLENDRDAWRWLTATARTAALVATKVDKLSRAERQRAMRSIEAVFDDPVTAVSAETGEGLEELWKLIDRLATHRQAQGRLEPHRATNSSNPRRSRPLPPNRTAAADRPGAPQRGPSAAGPKRRRHPKS